MGTQTGGQNKQFIYSFIQLASVLADSVRYRRAVSDNIQKIVLFDFFCFTLVDLSTFLTAGAITDDKIETIHPSLFACKYQHHDYTSYEQLASKQIIAASLNENTTKEFERSRRYHTVLKPAGFCVLLEAYEVTAREKEISHYVLKGSSTKEISVLCHLSPYTVQDHLKSIFLKMDVSNRRSLVAKLTR